MSRNFTSVGTGPWLGSWRAGIAIAAVVAVAETTSLAQEVKPAADPWDPPATPAHLASTRRPVRDDKPYWRQNLFKRVLVDQKYFVTRWLPSEVRDPAFSVPLGSALVIAGSSRRGARGLDDRAEFFVGRWIRGQAEDSANLLTELGDADTAFVLVGSTYLVARLTHNDRLSETSSLAAEALINTAIWSSALKRLTSRARPGDASSSRLLNDPATAGKDFASFPSGHAMGAFAAAVIVSGQYPDKKWVPWVAYGTASLIAASRVALGQHYVSDVVAGAALGRSIGKMVLARAHGAPDARVPRWSPIVDPATASYGMTYSRAW